MCLLTTLSTFYPSFMFLFQLSMTIDISCHWLHVHTALLQGSTSHKFIDPTGNYWMKLYYTDRRGLFAMCAGENDRHLVPRIVGKDRETASNTTDLIRENPLN